MVLFAVYLTSLESWNDKDCNEFLERFVVSARTLINNLRIVCHIFGEDGTFTTTGCANDSKVTLVISVEKVVNSREDKFTTDKVLALFLNDLLKLRWMSSGIDCSG
ncbi:MAG: hypothetical protein V7L27_05550 [Nostoc sp.]|uniref:hypothetical protein n=1 Tax=Nostoc sp. TaxID=1180 RepID=UPI002FF781E8